MGYYKGVWCPHCNFSFTGGIKRQVGTGTLLGPPYIRCPSCKGLVGTGKKSWSQMSLFDRIQEISIGLIKLIGSSLVFAIIVGLFVALIFGGVAGRESFDKYSTYILYFCVGFGCLIASAQIYSYYSSISYIEALVKAEKWDDAYEMFGYRKTDSK